jgi:hypothetical protein
MLSRLLIISTVAEILAAACGAAQDGSRAATTGTHQARFAFGGFSLAIPAGWHTGASMNDDGAAYLTVASNDVDEHEAALGIGSQSGMPSNDVLISVTEVKTRRIHLAS